MTKANNKNICNQNFVLSHNTCFLKVTDIPVKKNNSTYEDFSVNLYFIHENNKIITMNLYIFILKCFKSKHKLKLFCFIS